MVRPPTREAEDARRLVREREALLAERIRHANRIKGLLATQGVFGFEPTLRDRRARLVELRTPEGAALPSRLGAEICRQMDRLELTMQQLAAVEAERDAAFAAERATFPATGDVGKKAAGGKDTPAAASCSEGPGARLLRLKGVGPETASVLAGEAFFRDFRNRREVASYAGLAPPLVFHSLREQNLDQLRPARGRAAASTTSRASQRLAMRACARPWGSWPGCGCATNPTARSAPGIATGSATDGAASSASRLRRSRASCWWHSGGSSRKASCRPAPC